MNYWLMKSEPDTFSIDDLQHRPTQIEAWDGVRNYQVRNMLRDQMKLGDLAFFYHSSCKVPGIVGIMKVVKEGYVDTSAFDASSPYYDPKSKPSHPTWYRVDVKFVKKFKNIITLSELRNNAALRHMQLLKQGNRLSITSVSPLEWQTILNIT